MFRPKKILNPTQGAKMTYQETVKSLEFLTSDELTRLNKTLIAILKQRRTITALTSAAAFKIGDTVIFNCPGKWDGARGEIRKMGRTGKATVAVSQFGRVTLVTGPAQYLIYAGPVKKDLV